MCPPSPLLSKANMSLNPFAAPYTPKSLNPHATPYIPNTPIDIPKLLAMPFFQQRLDCFLYTNYRITDVRVENLQVFLASPPLPPQKKKTVVFLGAYQAIPLLYEADRWEDPRTGAFIKMAA